MVNSTSAMPPPASSLLEGTILVVEDDSVVLKVAQLILEKAGFQVLVATDGTNAIERFREHHQQIRAVLLDLGLPRVSGEEVFSQIRQLNPEVPIILASGFAESTATEHFTAQGPTIFIQKPFKPQVLLERLKGLLL